MPTQVAIQATPVFDPRGAFRRQAVKLAFRPANLNGKKVLLFDNTQLTSQLPNYGPIFHWLAPNLEGEHGAKCVYDQRNLLKASRSELTQLAQDILRRGVDAVVIVLCNAGITQPTSLFAAELEARSIPCVQVVTELGLGLAGITASNYVPGLPIVLALPATGEAESFGNVRTTPHR